MSIPTGPGPGPVPEPPPQPPYPQPPYPQALYPQPPYPQPPDQPAYPHSSTPPYPQAPYPQPPYPGPASGPSSAVPLGIVGLVLAFLFWPAGIVVSVLGLAAARREHRARGLSLAGLLTSSAFGLVTVLVVVGLLAWGGDDAREAGTGGATAAAPGAAAGQPADPGAAAGGAQSAAPGPASDDGGLPLAPDGSAQQTALDADAPVLDLYIDYMCPYCGRFESVNGATLNGGLADGDVVVVLHPIAILDSSSRGSHYSTRAANALATVADAAPDRTLAFHEALFAHQPTEGTSGLSDAELRDLAVSVGVPADVADTFADGRFDAWVAARTDAATSSSALAGPQGFGTPTIVLDGERWAGNWSQAGELDAAIADAARAGGSTL